MNNWYGKHVVFELYCFPCYECLGGVLGCSKVWFWGWSICRASGYQQVSRIAAILTFSICFVYISTLGSNGCVLLPKGCKMCDKQGAQQGLLLQYYHLTLRRWDWTSLKQSISRKRWNNNTGNTWCSNHIVFSGMWVSLRVQGCSKVRFCCLSQYRASGHHRVTRMTNRMINFMGFAHIPMLRLIGCLLNALGCKKCDEQDAYPLRHQPKHVYICMHNEAFWNRINSSRRLTHTERGSLIIVILSIFLVGV